LLLGQGEDAEHAVLWELAFPTMIDVVIVTEGGVITYSGMFKPKGDFIQARVQRGKAAQPDDGGSRQSRAGGSAT
jgi:hypothetical protein